MDKKFFDKYSKGLDCACCCNLIKCMDNNIALCTKGFESQLCDLLNIDINDFDYRLKILQRIQTNILNTTQNKGKVNEV